MLAFKTAQATLLTEQINHVGQLELREYLKTKKEAMSKMDNIVWRLFGCSSAWCNDR